MTSSPTPAVPPDARALIEEMRAAITYQTMPMSARMLLNRAVAILTVPPARCAADGSSDARARDLADAKAWLCKRWHQDHPNEQHIKQLADYAAYLRATPPASDAPMPSYVADFLRAVRNNPGGKHPIDTYYPAGLTLTDDLPDTSWEIADSKGWVKALGSHKWELTPAGIAAIGAVDAGLAPASDAAVPAGFVLVPRIATRKMVDAADACPDAYSAYAAMVEAGHVR